MSVKKIEISHKTIIFAVFLLLGLWFIYQILDVILQVFLSLLIMTILNPVVTKLNKYRVPRVVSVLLVYIAMLCLFVFAIVVMAPPLVEQTTRFTNSIPEIMQQLNIPIVVVDQVTKDIAEQLSTLPSQVLKISVSVFSNVMSVLAVLFFALYFLLARTKLETKLSGFVGKHWAQRIDNILRRLEKDLGEWAIGKLFIMLFVGFATYIGLSILGVPFALPLAVLAGILEIIPNFGPVISSVPSIIVAFGISPFTGFAVMALFFLVQQLESYVITPKVMERSVKIDPIITLLSLVIGFKLAGILGAILSIPMVVTARTLLSEFVLSKYIDSSASEKK